MKITLAEIVDSVGPINDLLKLEFSAKASYAITKNAHLLTPEIKIYEEKRVELVKRYGHETPPGSGNFSVLTENLQTFAEALGELRSIEVELPIHKIVFSENDRVRPELLFPIDWMLE